MEVVENGTALRGRVGGPDLAGSGRPGVSGNVEVRGDRWRRGLRGLFASADGASVAVFRIAFGIIMAWEVVRHFVYGWIPEYYINPTFYFTFPGFGWVRPLPGELMYAFFVALGVIALFVAAGFLYRLSMVLLFLGFSYVFLLDQTQYLNHFYLICLISFLMIFVPANRVWSVDAALRPGLRARGASVPTWAVWTLRLQLGIVYLYGGFAKLNADWLRGEPMGLWLEDASWGFSSEWVLDFVLWEWSPLLFAYGGLLFDLLVFPALLWRRTLPFAFVALVAFHYTNAQVFSIGIFPMLGIATATIFLAPDWPRRLARAAKRLPRRLASRPAGRRPNAGAGTGPATFGVRGGADPAGGARFVLNWRRHLVVGALAVFFAGQILFPFRHYLYPGNVSWTEEGHNFSWHMKLRDKVAETRFFVTDPTSGREWEVDARDYLTERQALQMGERPDMILQFAHHVEEDLARRGVVADAEVRVRANVELNGREPQLLVDPDVDLTEKERSLLPADWILPLETPLVGTYARATGGGD